MIWTMSQLPATAIAQPRVLRARDQQNAHGGVAGLGEQQDPWLTDTTAKPVATERVSPDWVGREP
jgi:hypothetical protein